MPKKTASARGGASRSKPKSQRSVQLVRPVSVESDVQGDIDEEETAVSATSTAAAASTATVTKSNVTAATKSEVAAATKAEASKSSEPLEQQQPNIETNGTNKSSASARLAARRQQVQRQQAQRSVNLITSEHYAYVKRDLIYIAVLACIFFTALIVLHFIPAIGG